MKFANENDSPDSDFGSESFFRTMNLVHKFLNQPYFSITIISTKLKSACEEVNWFAVMTCHSQFTVQLHQSVNYTYIFPQPQTKNCSNHNNVRIVGGVFSLIIVHSNISTYLPRTHFIRLRAIFWSKTREDLLSWETGLIDSSKIQHC